ncbi:CYFIP-related Rac1 interactor A-like isoform X1 [Tyto alba]|uniref:CYFIP-related Rac1 interactor A-like isoform X1 n=1 Tax=Tyto alba TaxID=56313 RepID=UPI001C66B7E5|nr:CYFIP-related Rac1 interactor A-like isoform X1 [Tyto alba]
MPDPAQPRGPRFLPLPRFLLGAQLRARARGVKIVQAATTRPGPGGERPRTAHHTTSSTGTSQNSWGWGHTAALLPQRGTFLAPSRQNSLCPPPAPSAAPQVQGRGSGGSPGPPVSGLAPQLELGDACSQDFGDSLTASPSTPEPGGSLLPSLLPLHHPIRQRSSPSRGGRGCSPGPGAAAGSPTGQPGAPRAPRDPRGEDGGSGRRRPLPAAQHLFPERHLTIMLFSSCFFSCRFHMGNLLKVLTYNELDQGPNFFLDFENAQPTEAETAVWNQVNAVLEEAQAVLAELQSYTGAGQEIREAIQNPGDLRLQERAWSAVCPLVAKLKRFYEFSLRLENALRSLLEALTSPPYAPTQHLEREQALAKQFAEILHFTLSFDELKMTNPAIQNDFSYYRRTISRNRINNLQLDAESEVNNEMANRMSLFYAEATPMLKTLSNATTKFVSENKTLPIEDTTDCLSTMACVCRVMLETPEYRSRFTNTETLLFCMRVMVGVIILYDHVHPVGAFAKTSKIDMKGCIKVLKDQPSTSTEGLLNALRYTTRHLNDDTTSKQIRALLQ